MWFKESTLESSFVSLPPQRKEYHGWIDFSFKKKKTTQPNFLHEEEYASSLVFLTRKELLTDRSRSRWSLLLHCPVWPETGCSPRHTPAHWGFHSPPCVLGLWAKAKTSQASQRKSWAGEYNCWQQWRNHYRCLQSPQRREHWGRPRLETSKKRVRGNKYLSTCLVQNKGVKKKINQDTSIYEGKKFLPWY